MEAVLVLGMVLACCTGVVAIPLVILNITGVTSIVVIMSLWGFSAGLIAPNANAGVLAKFKEIAAPTSALVSVALFATASLTSTIAMNLYIKDTLWPVLLYLVVLSLGGLAAGYFWVWLPYRAKSSLPGERKAER